mgnify:CR=1 FL=1
MWSASVPWQCPSPSASSASSSLVVRKHSECGQGDLRADSTVGTLAVACGATGQIFHLQAFAKFQSWTYGVHLLTQVSNPARIDPSGHLGYDLARLRRGCRHLDHGLARLPPEQEQAECSSSYIVRFHPIVCENEEAHATLLKGVPKARKDRANNPQLSPADHLSSDRARDPDERAHCCMRCC